LSLVTLLAPTLNAQSCHGNCEVGGANAARSPVITRRASSRAVPYIPMEAKMLT